MPTGYELDMYRDLRRIAEAAERIAKILQRDLGEDSDVREEIARVRTENNALRAELEQVKGAAKLVLDADTKGRARNLDALNALGAAVGLPDVKVVGNKTGQPIE